MNQVHIGGHVGCTCKEGFYNASLIGLAVCYGPGHQFDGDHFKDHPSTEDEHCQQCDTRCMVCPKGQPIAVKPEWALSSTALAHYRTTRYRTTSYRPTGAAIFSCPLSGGCRGQQLFANNNCSKGYTNTLCGVCAANWIKDGNGCADCSGAKTRNGILTTILLCIGLLAGIALYSAFTDTHKAAREMIMDGLMVNRAHTPVVCL
jgi:hypothetical protein